MLYSLRIFRFATLAGMSETVPLHSSSVGDDPDGLALLTIAECAALLHVSSEAVRAKVRSGELRAYRLGDGPKARYRVESASLATYLRDAREARIETR